MSGERIDDDIERQSQEGFVGREDVLAEIDRQLAAISSGWVLVTGGPGTGKSAILSEWIARRNRARHVDVLQHFIRRDTRGAQPHVILESLAMQVERRFPEARNPEVPLRLADLLASVSRYLLVPRGEYLDVVIDGLDEVKADSAGTPLPRFLPAPLPPGVRFLCATRPEQPQLDWLTRQRGVRWLDLDTTWVQSNRDTVARYWTAAAAELSLTADTVKRLVAAADGNILHAVMVHDALKSSPPGWSIYRLPPGIVGLVRELWERCAADSAVSVGLGLLCAAREALPLDLVGELSGWNGADRVRFLQTARPLLLEESDGGKSTYRPRHDWIQQQLVDEIGAVPMRAHHRALAAQLATWPAPAQPDRRRYALRHALLHLIETESWDIAWTLARDTGFLEAKCRELGVHETEFDLTRTTERCRLSGDSALARRFEDLARVVARESHWLRDVPEATAALLWNRLRRSGWTTDALDEHLRIPSDTTFLRVRHAATRDSALVRSLVGHAAPVTACTVTSDGGRVISASADQMLKVWDLVSGRILATFEGHTDIVSACAVTPDGRRVISGSMDQTLKVWDLDSGRLLTTLHGHVDPVTACAVTPDNRRVVSASWDGTLKVWDLDSGGLITTLHCDDSGVYACAVTSDNRRAVSALWNTLKLWDLDSSNLVATFKGHSHRVLACAVTPDCRRMVSASEDQTLKVWDLDSRRLLFTLNADRSGGSLVGATSCAVTPDGHTIVSASRDGILRVWDLDSGHLLTGFAGHAGWVTACVVTPDGRHVVSASDDQTLKVWDLSDLRALADSQGHADCVTACVVTPDGRRVVSTSEDETLRVWHPESGRVVSVLYGHAAGITTCAMMSDARRMVSASHDDTLKVWDLDSGQVLATIDGHGRSVKSCVVTPDGRRVVSVSYEGTLRVWDLESGYLIATFEGHTRWVNACAVTPDGRSLVSASGDQTLKVWDLASCSVLATFEGHTGGVNACAVTPDGRRVVSASGDRTLKVWDLASGSILATFEGHAGGVNACAVTPDGRRVISASNDATLKVWDLSTYAYVLTHRGDSIYTTVAATATIIVAGDWAGTVWFLDWPPSNRRAEPLRVSQNHDNQRRPLSDNETLSPRPLMKKHTILFLAANPLGTDRLALDREARAIQVELERSGHRDCFEFVTRWAAEPLDLLRELRRLRPTVVHYSGHGGQNGLFFQAADGSAQIVSTEAIAETFGAAGTTVKLVVLNACYSEAEAEALLAHVDCVVGMNGPILDDAARNFAIGFYGGLGERESVAAAYKQGRAAISLEGLRDSHRPHLKVRDGVDADQIVLAADPQ